MFKELRNTIGIKEKTPVEIDVKEDTIVLQNINLILLV